MSRSVVTGQDVMALTRSVDIDELLGINSLGSEHGEAQGCPEKLWMPQARLDEDVPLPMAGRLELADL